MNKILSFLFILSISFYYIIVTQVDIRGNFFEDGLLLSDDRKYFLSAINNTYTEESKNYIYYAYNYLMQNIYDDVIIIIISNTLIFAISFALFIKSSNLKPNKFFSLTLLFFPVFFINSLNYKDSLFMSIVLLFFATKKNDHLNILTKLIIMSILIYFANGLRLGSSLLFLFSLLSFSILKYFNMNKIVCVIYFVLCTLTFLFLFDSFLNYLGRSIETYWQLQLRNVWQITPFYNVNILITGLIKSIFQFNLFSYSNFIVYGEHGYNGFVLKVHYLLFCIIYPFILLIIFLRSKCFKLCEFSIFILFYAIIYSYIYGGLIGLRLSCLLVLYLMIKCCFISQNLIYEKKY